MHRRLTAAGPVTTEPAPIRPAPTVRAPTVRARVLMRVSRACGREVRQRCPEANTAGRVVLFLATKKGGRPPRPVGASEYRSSGERPLPREHCILSNCCRAASNRCRATSNRCRAAVQRRFNSWATGDGALLSPAGRRDWPTPFANWCPLIHRRPPIRQDEIPSLQRVVTIRRRSTEPVTGGLNRVGPQFSRGGARLGRNAVTQN